MASRLPRKAGVLCTPHVVVDHNSCTTPDRMKPLTNKWKKKYPQTCKLSSKYFRQVRATHECMKNESLLIHISGPQNVPVQRLLIDGYSSILETPQKCEQLLLEKSCVGPGLKQDEV